jgi:CheY-like chemotaxis protein
VELEAFEDALHEVLAHLHDPTYIPSEEFWIVMGVPTNREHRSLHDRIVDAIQSLEPAGDVPATSRTRRYYELLSSRYVHEMTQKETAHQLNVSPRHLRREQNQAVRILAQRLWHRHFGQVGEGSEKAPAPPRLANSWMDQIHEELAVLRDTDPYSTSSVSSELSRAMNIVHPILADKSIALSRVERDSNLVATVHPSILRQVLILSIEDLAERMDDGAITIRTQERGESVEVSLTAEPFPEIESDFDSSMWRILADEGGQSDFYQQGGRGVIRFRFPLTQPVSVLVIDDNEDVVHVYRRYTEGTQYQISHLDELSHAVEQVGQARPNIIVLDVMMPNVDGWELLTDLRRDPSTKDIPVIICSVIRREGFAQALGAAAHISKPIRSHQFLETLDRVWQSVSAI